MNQIPFYTAFGAGLISFVSPCVLPLVPGYLSFLSGVSLDQLQETEAQAGIRGRVLANSLAFVFGFSLVFVLLGASATFVGKLLLEQLPLLSKLAGALIVLFGLHTMGVLRFGWLYREKRVQIQRKPVGLLGSALVGVAFAFGWTPCIGPILAGILTYASTQETMGQGIGLLALYSLGLGVPFVLAGLGFERFLAIADRFKRKMRAIELASGLLLVVIGLMIATNGLTWLSGRLGFLGQFAL
ncbi:cytochrome c biogenesis protein CcdA [bacterium]|nr:cytochrome c biogenesis protein CcdA [bacterium]